MLLYYEKKITKKIILLILCSFNSCFLIPCDCPKINTKKDNRLSESLILLKASDDRTRSQTSNYSCFISSENNCYEFRNQLKLTTDDTFCKLINGSLSEKTCVSENKLGTCSFPENANLQKIYYSPIWNKTLSQTDCTNLKGVWKE